MKKIARIGIALFAVFVCFLTTVCLYIRWQVEETTKKINFSLIEISDEVRELSVEERREWRGDAWKMSDEEYTGKFCICLCQLQKIQIIGSIVHHFQNVLDIL